MLDTLDLTPTQQDALEADLYSPSDADMAWYLEATYVDPYEVTV